MKSKRQPKTHPEKLVKSNNLFPVVGIGASAGGLDAFKKLLKAIPEDSGIAYVLVQHLDPNHESLLPELLQKVTSIPVLEITDDIKVEPNRIYVIPSNKMMIATDGILQLAPRPAKARNEHNLPIDFFFSSLAEVHQSHAIGVVLSGTGSDGTRGLKAIKDHGGITLAQDQASASYSGMPNSATQANVVDFILPPEKIPQKIIELVSQIDRSDDVLQNLPQHEEDIFKQILSLIRLRKGTDFSYYKQTTVRRRILRRMALNKIKESAIYLKLLRENKGEQDILYQDLLIPVTSFFRDPKIFDSLCESVFPQIIKSKAPGDIIRVWVAGCSTGEETYSIAMCFKELLGDTQRAQIFATDLSEPAIAKARNGTYTKKEVESVSPQRLQDFFNKTDGGYQINKSVRDMCVFAVHNFLKDPPFGKMDFISCRNVLIYMEPYLQKKALTTFHYALNLKGFLLLGKTETIGGVPDLFSTVGKNDKLFTRKDVPGKFMHVASHRSEQGISAVNITPHTEPVRTDFQKIADDIMLRKYTPVGVVVNEAMDIVHFRGKTGNYLEQLSGKPSHNVLQMAKDGLAFELRNILHKARKQRAVVKKEGIPVLINGLQHHVSIEAMPLPNTIESHYLILFHDNKEGIGKKTPGREKKKSSTAKTKKDTHALRAHQLEEELEQTREDMRSITEEQEAVNEELQSANEELLSSSEELQSLNEELETGKEELQSTNEELMVVNQEIVSLNESITEARNYAEAIIASIRTPLVVLDESLRVKSANRTFYKTFHVNEADTEGKLIYDLGNKEWDIPSLRTLLEKVIPEKSTMEDYEVRHTFKSIGDRIMLLNAREIKRETIEEKLILLAFEDVTEQRQQEHSEHLLLSKFQNLIMQTPTPICIFKGEEMRLEVANDKVLNIWNVGRGSVGKAFLEIKPEMADQPFIGYLIDVFRNGVTRYGMEQPAFFVRENGEKEHYYFNFVYQPYREPDDTISGVIVMAFDVTQEVIVKKKIEESEKQFRQLAELMPQKIFTADAAGHKNYFNQTWLDYTGLTLEKLKGLGWQKLIHPDDWAKTGKFWEEAIQSGENYEREDRLLRKDGQYLWHLTRAIALKDEDGKVKLWVGSKTEIQEQREQKEVLEKAIENRTHELNLANEGLKEKNEELERVNHELEAFAYVSSHDLQEPLRRIRIFSDMILDKENQNLTDNGKNYFRLMNNSAERMQALIHDLLAFSRVSIGERKFEKVKFYEIVEEVKAEFKERIDEVNATVEVNGSCEMHIIRFQFRQILSNLISNSIKFSKRGTPLHIIISCYRAKSEELPAKLSPQKEYDHITFADNGIGFENEFSEKVFELFQKLHGKDEYAGTGMGLAIVKKIVDNHHGVITATSELNKGTTFDLYILATQ